MIISLKCALIDNHRLSVRSPRGGALPLNPTTAAGSPQKGSDKSMAIYHCHCKIISRGQGRSAVGAAAYRSGEKLYNEYDGIEHNYTKKEGVIYSEIMLCENVPKEYQNRQILWNAVEQIEKSSNAQLAREYEVALPVELSREEQIKLVRDFAKENFVDKGMCVDFSVHDKGDGNPHAHIMLTTRPINKNGEWGAKEKKDYVRDENGERVPIIDKKTGLQKVDNRNRKQWKREYVQFNDWNTKEFLQRSRESWAEKVNRELERKNVPQRIDHRSYKEQGVDQIPTIHIGVSANAMEKRGIESRRGNENREIQTVNEEIAKLEENFIDTNARSNSNEVTSGHTDQKSVQLGKAHRKLDEKKQIVKDREAQKGIQTEKSYQRHSDPCVNFMIDIQKKIDEGKGDAYIRWATLYNLKQAANAMMFVSKNKISGLDDLAKKTLSHSTKRQEFLEKIKSEEARLAEIAALKKHIINYAKYKDIYAAYKASGFSKEYWAEHRAELTVRKAAQTAFKEYERQHPERRHGEKYTLPSIKELNAEYSKILSQKNKNYELYKKEDADFKESMAAQRILETMLQKESAVERQKNKKKDRGDER